MAKIPAEHSHAFWAWAKCVGEIIFWATNPDAETTSGDGWREHFRNDIRDKGDRARDASPDDVTRNQVSRSRSLASQLVRMLNETSELNASPCRNWSQVDRFVVEQLAELQSHFAKLGDGEHTTEAATVTAMTGNDTKPEPSWPMGTGWEFRPGEAAFQGRPFVITGKPVIILQRLAVKPGAPVLKRILRDIIDPDSNAEEGCVRDNINATRAILRKAFNLKKGIDPIPNLARGPDAAWKLDENAFAIATKNPR